MDRKRNVVLMLCTYLEICQVVNNFPNYARMHAASNLDVKYATYGGVYKALARPGEEIEGVVYFRSASGQAIGSLNTKFDRSRLLLPRQSSSWVGILQAQKFI